MKIENKKTTIGQRSERDILFTMISEITGKSKQSIKNYFCRKLWSIRKPEHFKEYLDKFYK